MHATYNFHFLDTVSEQLCKQLDGLPVTCLHTNSLDTLTQFQAENNARQGVYLLHVGGRPVYLGKADDVRERLAQHLEKLSGRQSIDLTSIGYKALLLDRSMSTAANETVLIGFFQQNHSGMWNNRGFGPKDPGRQRDNTRPSQFDQQHPIRDDFPVIQADDTTTVGALLSAMKAQLPYVFRYDIGGHGNESINLAGVPRTARALLQAVVSRLGAGWKGVVLSFGMVLYRTGDRYEYGAELLP